MTTEYFANYSRVPTHPGFGPWKQDAYSYHKRANLAPANMYFYYVNGAQAAIGLILNSWELYSVVSKVSPSTTYHSVVKVQNCSGKPFSFRTSLTLHPSPSCCCREVSRSAFTSYLRRYVSQI